MNTSSYPPQWQYSRVSLRRWSIVLVALLIFFALPLGKAGSMFNISLRLTEDRLPGLLEPIYRISVHVLQPLGPENQLLVVQKYRLGVVLFKQKRYAESIHILSKLVNSHVDTKLDNHAQT